MINNKIAKFWSFLGQKKKCCSDVAKGGNGPAPRHSGGGGSQGVLRSLQTPRFAHPTNRQFENALKAQMFEWLRLLLRWSRRGQRDHARAIIRPSKRECSSQYASSIALEYTFSNWNISSIYVICLSFVRRWRNPDLGLWRIADKEGRGRMSRGRIPVGGTIPPVQHR